LALSSIVPYLAPMPADDPTGTDWTTGEIDLIVADYFDMFRLELAGVPVNKAERNRALQALIKRSRGSIEFKHQNISAALERLGCRWIDGYKPRFNFQSALLDGIERFLSTRPDVLDVPLPAFAIARQSGLAEAGPIYLEPAPVLQSSDGADPPALRRLVRKFDPAARDARNRDLGKRGEERIFLQERQNLLAAGLGDLARKVRWVAEEDGDGAGYDIRSFAPDGREKLLEVKTTIGAKLTPFFLTHNEKAVSDERPDAFRIVRLYDFARVPRAFELSPPLENCVLLRPQVYRASFA
jgi:hypothetical protein